MNVQTYTRQLAQMARCQSSYDNMEPPEYWHSSMYDDEDDIIDPDDGIMGCPDEVDA